MKTIVIAVLTDEIIVLGCHTDHQRITIVHSTKKKTQQQSKNIDVTLRVEHEVQEADKSWPPGTSLK
ncbi:hypothetical protein SERLA73DRAFT_174403 [Serpula lacrymans var. lacrymans S7.3]|uniref:Uncharacterized protein n=2 Tax=Serpula lacrymans var. lacrymans TaxID=341189 RepID=F8PFM0_SERL3|nr:uncharacterized protein SERLADRAFT_455909 [Serpula lacrymans var. lacrymans S7.9]EGO05309.1 hypothetical protein SERLA73DRAFT_174403 [Serpula lacrymans var. lacrymans S7.3]EGO31166.1 hypothetical protein SERLADRAFT_455909 [Serpula lacrymans var. lacrymans S7.9]